MDYSRISASQSPCHDQYGDWYMKWGPVNRSSNTLSALGNDRQQNLI
jgi:hypothetical protein